MRKDLLALAVLACAPTLALANDNVGGCGLGSKLFSGQSGIAPQVLAVTTNGTSGNQTFGITTGTSGCTQEGVVRSNWKTAMFIDANATKLAKDMSAGGGETLASLAGLLGMNDSERSLFYSETKANFQRIYPSVDTTSQQVIAGLRQVLESNSQLSRFAANI